MRILFTKKVKVKLLKNYEYMVSICIVFFVLSVLSLPKEWNRGIVEDKGIIESYVIKRETFSSVKSPSRGYSDYYEIHIKGVSIPYKCYDVEEIKKFGINRMLHYEVEMEILKTDEFNVIRRLSINGKTVLETTEIEYGLFLLFVGLFLVTMVWSIWGFYITYLVSDEKRKEILCQ